VMGVKLVMVSLLVVVGSFDGEGELVLRMS